MIYTEFGHTVICMPNFLCDNGTQIPKEVLLCRKHVTASVQQILWWNDGEMWEKSRVYNFVQLWSEAALTKIFLKYSVFTCYMRDYLNLLARK